MISPFHFNQTKRSGSIFREKKSIKKNAVEKIHDKHKRRRSIYFIKKKGDDQSFLSISIKQKGVGHFFVKKNFVQTLKKIAVQKIHFDRKMRQPVIKETPILSSKTKFTKKKGNKSLE